MTLAMWFMLLVAIGLILAAVTLDPFLPLLGAMLLLVGAVALYYGTR